MTPEEHLARRLRRQRTLASYQRSFERDGDKGALLWAITYCAEFRIPLPKWAMEAFKAAQGRATRGEIGSSDEVFGKPWGDGRRKAQWMKSRGREIWIVVGHLREFRGMSIEGAFAKVAAKKHMTVPTVRRLYYKQDRLEKAFSNAR
jgi:hypothetical protein